MRTILFVILAGSFMVLGSCGSGNDIPSKSGTKVYAIAYNGLGWETDVILNGVPILQKEKGGGYISITGLVRNKHNTLEVRATQIDDVPIDSLALQIVTTMASTPAEIADVLAKFKCESIGKGKSITRILEFEASVPIQWTWEKASVVRVLSGPDREAILSEVRKLYESLRSKDLNAYDNVRSAYIHDMAKYTGTSEDKVMRGDHALLRKSFADPSYQMELRKSDEIIMKPCGQIVLVQGKGEFLETWVVRSRISSADGGERFVSYRDLFLCKIAGKWQIVN